MLAIWPPQLTHLSSERRVQQFGRFPLHPRQQVSVGVEGEAHARVAEPFADGLRVHALSQEVRRMRMAKIVEVYWCHAGLPNQTLCIPLLPLSRPLLLL